MPVVLEETKTEWIGPAFPVVDKILRGLTAKWKHPHLARNQYYVLMGKKSSDTCN